MQPFFITLLLVVPILLIGSWAYLRLHTYWETPQFAKRWIIPIGQQIVSGLSAACVCLLVIECVLFFVSPYSEHGTPFRDLSWQILLDVLAGTSVALLISSAVVSYHRHKMTVWGVVIGVLGLLVAAMTPAILPACKI